MSTVDREECDVTLAASGETLPRGWKWGRHWSGVGCSGHYAIRTRDGFAVEIADRPDYDVTPAAAIRAAMAAGEIPRLA